MNAKITLYLLIRKNLRKIVYVLTISLHLAAIFLISFNTQAAQEREDSSVFKVVDIDEYIPPPPPPPKEEKVEEEEVVEVTQQDAVADDIITTDKEIKEVEIDYLPQHKISEVPVIPVAEIRSRIVYPPLALRQGIEGVVYLQLFIDQMGVIRQVDIIQDPGYGFGEAARNAILGTQCLPAKSNGVPVAVAFRFPLRFTLR